jgi:membrane protein DedA with SNARE-associated domain
MKTKAAMLAMLKWRWLVHLGAPGLLIVGLIDESFLPLPGSLDVVTVVLTARRPDQWPIYWLMATVGAVLGGHLTYRISKKGGKETLQKRLPRRQIERIQSVFERHGFLAVFVAGLLPPPFPMVTVLAGAGALQYPTRKFLGSLTASRVIRYGILIWLARIFGRSIIRELRAHEVAIIIAYLVFAIGAVAGGSLYVRYQKRKESTAGPTGQPAADAGEHPPMAA